MLKAFSTPRNRNRTFILFAICCVLAVTSAAVGISDNPPGLLLAFLSASVFIITFVHPWRASKHFRRLIYASILGFVVFGVLHNVFEGVASNALVSGLMHDLLSGAGVASFLVAIFLCPPGLLVGAVGAIVMFIRERHSQPGALAT